MLELIIPGNVKPPIVKLPFKKLTPVGRLLFGGKLKFGGKVPFGGKLPFGGTVPFKDNVALAKLVNGGRFVASFRGVSNVMFGQNVDSNITPKEL